MKLHKAHIAETQTVGDRDSKRTVEYRVTGLPSNEEALLGNLGAEHWSIVRIINGRPGKWYGDHSSADAALAALQEELTAAEGEPATEIELAGLDRELIQHMIQRGSHLMLPDNEQQMKRLRDLGLVKEVEPARFDPRVQHTTPPSYGLTAKGEQLAREWRL